MGLRQDLERIVEKKKADIRSTEMTLHAARAALEAYEETLKRLLREETVSHSARELRAGSSVAKAQEAIKRAGKPLRIEEILKAISKPNDKKNRISLSGSLAHYVRNGQIFTRPEPNTFGLTEFNHVGEDDDEDTIFGEKAENFQNGKT